MRFLLFVGANNTLAQAEVANKLPNAKAVSDQLYVIESDENIADTVSALGSSLKLAKEIDGQSVSDLAGRIEEKSFSITCIDDQKKTQSLNLALKEVASNKRYVLANDPFGLSPVILKKQKAAEFFQYQNAFFQTVWYHDFEHWIQKDRQLLSNAKAGMLPPKIARSMVNLVPFNPKGKKLIDPFCGSGRILVEAAELGFDVVGVDIQERQVRDSQSNLQNLGLKGEVILGDATHLSSLINTKVDAIVTEPFLGKADFRPDQAKFIAPGLEKLYLGCLKDWSKILNDNGVIVMVFPILKGVKTDYKTSKIIDSIRLMSYNQLNNGIIYSKPEAKLLREIIILQKK